MTLQLTAEQTQRLKTKQLAVDIAQSELYKEYKNVQKEVIETHFKNATFPLKVDVVLHQKNETYKAYIVGVNVYTGHSEPFAAPQFRKCKTDGTLSSHRLMDVKEILKIKL